MTSSITSSTESDGIEVASMGLPAMDNLSTSFWARQSSVEIFSSDSEAERSLNDPDDSSSVVSQRSGMTDAGSQMQQLQLNNSCKERRRTRAAANRAAETINKRNWTEAQIAGPRQAKRVKYMPAMWSGVKLGFISTARAAPLTAFQMAKLKAAILETTLTCITPGFRPRFAGCVPRQLWMLLICVDNNAADWVRSNFGQIKANSSLDIELLEEQQFPQAHLIRGYFHNSLHLSNETLLGYIEAQNEISTRQWRVVRRTVEGAMLHAAILVDEESLVTLTRWAGKIWYCFGRTKLILRNSFLKNKAANETFNQSLPNSH